MQLEIPNLREGYCELISAVIEKGQRTKPRGMPTREILNPTIVVHDPTDTLPLVENRRPNLAIAAAEATLLVGGIADSALMTRITSNFEAFLDGGDLHGAYGRRVASQLPAVVGRLWRDHDSRQAVVSIWDAQYDLFETARDLPCTLGFQFFVRSGKLQMLSRMRSQDLLLGLSYDLHFFSCLQLSVANAMGLEAGPLTHQPASLHLYERDLKRVEQLGDPLPPIRLHGFGQVGIVQDMREVMERARDVHAGFELPDETPSERWYRETLARYRV